MINLLKSFVRISLTFLYGKLILAKKNVKISSTAYINKKTLFGGQNIIHSKVNIVNSSVGYGTFIGINCNLPNVSIGAYCSFAHNIEVIYAAHPTSIFVSTHPAFYSLLKQSGFTYVSKQLFKECLFFDEKKNIYVKIGNDVWIGANVIILAGVEIADGAIIAAGSVVTKNVKPYDIVGGIPAKVIRSRFNNNQIEILNQIKWWNYSPQWIKNHSHLFADIELFADYIQKEKKGIRKI